MSLANLVKIDTMGNQASDLGLHSQTSVAVLPKPETLPLGEDAEFVYDPVAERPSFHYNGQWNQMASTSDLPPAVYGFTYMSMPKSIKPMEQFYLTDADGLVLDYANGVEYDNGKFTIVTPGVYHISVGAAFVDLAGYDFVQSVLAEYIMLNETVAITATAVSTWSKNAIFLATPSGIDRPLLAGDTVSLLAYFYCETDNGPVSIWGSDPLDPESAGYDGWLSVTYVSPLPPTYTRSPNVVYNGDGADRVKTMVKNKMALLRKPRTPTRPGLMQIEHPKPVKKKSPFRRPKPISERPPPVEAVSAPVPAPPTPSSTVSAGSRQLSITDFLYGPGHSDAPTTPAKKKLFKDEPLRMTPPSSIASVDDDKASDFEMVED